MTKLLSCREAARLDSLVAQAWALESGTLMESAATNLWHALSPLLAGLPVGSRKPRVVALAGRGNNGGDALALIRHVRFSGRADVAALVLQGETGALTARQESSLRAGGIPVYPWDSEEGRTLIGNSDLLLDGIAGTGLRNSLAGPALDLVRFVNGSGKPIVSIDLPSGLGDEASPGTECIAATWTLSIEPRKLILYAPRFRARAGLIVAVRGVFPEDLQFASEAELLDSQDLPFPPLSVPPGAHKGQRGRVAILAGSAGMVGAALLAARAARAAGAGLVTLYVDEDLYPLLSSGGSTDALGGSVVRKEESFRGEMRKHDAALVGSGWAPSSSHGRMLSELLGGPLPLVLDATALRLLPARPGLPISAPLAMTPHPGELSQMSGVAVDELLSAPGPVLRDLSSSWNAALIMKASTSWIADPDGGLRILDGQESGLGVAGSGDVLAGLAVGLMAGYSARSEAGSGRLDSKALLVAAATHLVAGRQARIEEGWFDASALIPRAAKLLGGLD